jgi:hypothetical protein
MYPRRILAALAENLEHVILVTPELFKTISIALNLPVKVVATSPAFNNHLAYRLPTIIARALY